MKFKVGDRVAVYAYGDRYTGKIANVASDRADVFWVEVDPEQTRDVTVTCSHMTVHEKQCRKLVKKELREFWIVRWPESSDEGTCSYSYEVREYAPNEGVGVSKIGKRNVEFIRVREVKRK